MPGLGDLIDQVEALAARAGDGDGDRSVELAREMEDLLCDGYAAVLRIDSRIRRLRRRRLEMLAAGACAQRIAELDELEERQRELERSAAEARRVLGRLRARFMRLGGARATAR